MHKTFLQVAAFLGAITVAMGAFGAHGLKKLVGDTVVTTFETGVRYQFYHVFALLAVGILYQYFPNKLLKIAGNLFLAGMLFFCGSLYILTLKSAMNLDGLKWVGPITPFGGVCFIAGWICLGLGIAKTK
jgi:uncharacterized membrane protein YgdD (TMEM256/DUF423 family)